MSTATLNAWITNLGDPCTIANDPGPPNPWVVAVTHCEGRVLNWSEERCRHLGKGQATTGNDLLGSSRYFSTASCGSRKLECSKSIDFFLPLIRGGGHAKPQCSGLQRHTFRAAAR